MDEAEKHAQAVIPQNAPLMKMILFGMIPESIRFAFDLTLYPKWVNDRVLDRSIAYRLKLSIDYSAPFRVAVSDRSAMITILS